MSEASSSILSPEFRPAAVAVFTTVALAAFEGMAVSAALPQVAADLGSIALLPWVITSFLLASGITTAIAGPFVDGLGVSRVFRYAVVVFAGAGGAAAFAPTMEIMIALRVVQGIGAGMLISSSLAAVALVYPQHLVGRAYAANSTIWGVMSVAGPALAALMLTYLNWRWLFIINVPLGLLALVAGWRTLPGPAGDAQVRVDVVGAVLIAALTTALLIALDAVSASALLWVLLGVALAAAYRRHARTNPDPVVRLEHAVDQPYRGLALGSGLLLAGAMAVASYVPLYVQAGRGGSSALTAWSVLFFSVGWTVGANVGSRLLDHYSESAITVAGFAFTVPSLLALSLLVWGDVALVALFATLVVAGLGIGLTTNAALTLLRAVTPVASIGRAGSVYQFARTQGIAFGAALGGAVVLLVVEQRIGDVETVRQVLAGETGEVGGEVSAAVRAGFAVAAATGAVVAAVGCVLMIRMRVFLTEARVRAGR